ncbi:MAG: cell surface protein, partial [Paludibacteraceae bacterium]|nr:cell surface protein [Paludibacteraceae bacterium]
MKTLLFILLSSVTPYLTRVFEYRPAPGQFINTIPTWEAGDTAEDMAQKAQDALADNEGGMVSLGSWGGYIVFGFDHEIINVPGAYDLKILGNATYAMSNPNDTTALGGSSEPGVVMVSRDDNGNGLPDDKWYEL